MRVGVDASCWANPRGYGRFTRGLLTELLARPARHEFVLLADQATLEQSPWPLPAHAQTAAVKTRQSATAAATAGGRRSLRDISAMARAVAGMRCDVFFFPSVYTYFPVRGCGQVLLGVHDIIAENYPDYVFPNRKHRLFWTLKGWLARRQADYIVTVSDYAGRSIARKFGWPQSRICVIDEAPDPVFRPIQDASQLAKALDAQGLGPETRFIVCLGGLNPHKNLVVLLEAVAELRRTPDYADLKLVLIGPVEGDTFTPGAAAVRAAIGRFGLDNCVRLTGYLADEEVACLLNAAQVLVMPSLEEGYGLGAVEAAACGTPVIATRNSPLPSLLGGGGLFIDPHNSAELRDALVTLLRDDTLRRTLGCQARERAHRLTWGRAADQFLGFLETLA